ncbi:hypothetical protein BZM27_05815 [Paraburkholderia steynii]|uniref:Uncharacterized protein n=1 Tax=Paraburkholderia steynii TaxID=1245441 RepID=A0A4R0XP42_9BURK|nr:hypothetical protein BZM27_05815 [Paraburkholderia steynii]
MLTIEYHEGAVTYLSDEGMAACAADATRHEEQQRLAQQDRDRAEILMWTTAAAVVVIAVLVLKQLIGG